MSLVWHAFLSQCDTIERGLILDLVRRRFKFQLCHFLAVWLLENPLTSPRPSFLNSRIIESIIHQFCIYLIKHLLSDRQARQVSQVINVQNR